MQHIVVAVVVICTVIELSIVLCLSFKRKESIILGIGEL